MEWNGERNITTYKLPDDIKIPKIINKLNLIGSPSVHMAEDSLVLVIGNNNRVGCVGVFIFPEDFNEPDYHIDANKELSPGLWYFDEEYHDNPGYDKIIDKMIKKNKYLKYK